MHDNSFASHAWIIAWILAIPLGFCLYFLPSIIAVVRRNNAGSVIVLNLFLGWTLAGWVISLALALKEKTRQVVVVQHPVVYQPPPRPPQPR